MCSSNKLLILMIAFSWQVPANADTYRELYEACYGSVELTDLVIDLAEGKATEDSYVSEEEADQVKTILASPEVVEKTLSEKLEAVMTFCTEGRILQRHNQQILNP